MLEDDNASEQSSQASSHQQKGEKKQTQKLEEIKSDYKLIIHFKRSAMFIKRPRGYISNVGF